MPPPCPRLVLTFVINKRMKRIVWLDALKLIAIFMVICVHCSDPFNVSPEARYNQDYNFWGSLYGSFLRPCVPLFVMITGILLLPVKLSMKDFFQKIYPKGPENGRTVQMNCESVGSDFQAIWQKILKRQVYANFGQSSVTKTLPSPLKARIGKSGNE